MSRASYEDIWTRGKDRIRYLDRVRRAFPFYVEVTKPREGHQYFDGPNAVLESWCVENCQSDFFVGHWRFGKNRTVVTKFRFKTERDASLFKLFNL